MIIDRRIVFQKTDGTKVELEVSRETVDRLREKLGREVTDDEVTGFILTGLRNVARAGNSYAS